MRNHFNMLIVVIVLLSLETVSTSSVEERGRQPTCQSRTWSTAVGRALATEEITWESTPTHTRGAFPMKPATTTKPKTKVKTLLWLVAITLAAVKLALRGQTYVDTLAVFQLQKMLMLKHTMTLKDQSLLPVLCKQFMVENENPVMNKERGPVRNSFHQSMWKNLKQNPDLNSKIQHEESRLQARHYQTRSVWLTLMMFFRLNGS